MFKITFAVLSLAADISHAEEMMWGIPNYFPPEFIFENDKPSGGVSDVLLELINERMGGVQSKYIRMSTPRRLSDLKNGEHICMPGLIKTAERERFAYFVLTSLNTPLQIVTRKNLINKFKLNSNGEVSPMALFSDKNFTGIIDKSRSYTELIDSMIKNLNNGQLVQSWGYSSNLSNFKIIAVGRADYTIEYEHVFNYNVKQSPANELDGLVSVPIEGMKLIESGIACPKNEWGLQKIKDLSKIIEVVKHDRRYINAQMKWLSPSLQAKYKKEFDKFYGAEQR